MMSSAFAFAGTQCCKQQRLPLFMDGHEIREANIREISREGPPYELEVYYDGEGNIFFKGGWSRFAEDHNLHQGWFLLFNFYYGTSKFDVQIFDCTQCQKKYGPAWK
jgi:hypothetical protein